MNALVRRNGENRIGTQVGFKRQCDFSDFSDFSDYHSQHPNNHIWLVRLPTGKRVFMTLDEVGYSKGNKIKQYVGEALKWIGNVSLGFFIVEDTLSIPKNQKAVEGNVYWHPRQNVDATHWKKSAKTLLSQRNGRAIGVTNLYK